MRTTWKDALAEIWQETWPWLIMIIAVLVLFWAAIWLDGCAKPARYSSDPNKPVTELTNDEIRSIFGYKDAEAELQAKIKTLNYIAWFQKLALLGIAASIFACFIGWARWGIPAGATCLLSFGIGTTLNEYWELIGIVCLGLGVAVCGIAIWRHRKEWFAKEKELTTTKTAVKEIVTGIEEAKNSGADAPVDLIRNTQKAVQSPETTAIVDKIREAL